MDEIIIDKTAYDPYFILGVTPEDSLEHITKEFRRKAKHLHPDKLNSNERNNPKLVLKRSKQFKILVDCYEFISNKKQNYNNSRKGKEPINVPSYDDLTQKSFDNTDELGSFNQKFNDMKLVNPNDFGYETERIGSLNENGNNFELLKQQYASSSYRPQQLFDNKNFNRQDFNKAFEYQQQQFKDDVGTNDHAMIIHKTTDGFNGYNSVTLDNCASVSSFNGVMIVGDNFGQTGIGYNDTYYSDYRQTFQGPKNPDQLNVPDNFQPTSSRNLKPLTKDEIAKQIRMRESQTLTPTGDGSRGNFTLQEQILLEKQKQELVNKVEQDRQFILQYQHLFDKQTIEDALNNRLLTSKDYQTFN
jgi:curved DNA-binding protein CbpA